MLIVSGRMVRVWSPKPDAIEFDSRPPCQWRVAQRKKHLVYTQGVVGSNPSVPTLTSRTDPGRYWALPRASGVVDRAYPISSKDRARGYEPLCVQVRVLYRVPYLRSSVDRTPVS